MQVLNGLERLIFQAPAWRLVVVVLAIMLVKTGVWAIPNMSAVVQIAENPFLNPFQDPNAQYNFWSWLGPYWAYVVGARTLETFFLFHLAFAVAFTVLFIGVLFARLPNRLARIGLIIFAAIPASATAYFWVGLDAVTLTLMTLALALPRRTWFVFPVAVLLGMQHFEQSAFAAAALLFALALGRLLKDTNEYPIKFAVALLTGAIVGKLVLFGIFDYFDVETEYGRVHWLQGHLEQLIANTLYHLHVVVFSVLGVGWLAVVRYLDLGYKAVPFVLTLGGLLLLLLVSGDQTRVLACISFPLVAVHLLLNQKFLSMLSDKEVALGFLAWILVPWAWVWGGLPKWSAFPFDVAYALHQLFGWLTVPADPSFWPF